MEQLLRQILDTLNGVKAKVESLEAGQKRLEEGQTRLE